MPTGIKKENLPSKMCVTCNRPFTWRKKWERCWDEVTTCSKGCNAKRRELAKKEGRLLPDDGDESDGEDDGKDKKSSSTVFISKGLEKKANKKIEKMENKERDKNEKIANKKVEKGDMKGKGMDEKGTRSEESGDEMVVSRDNGMMNAFKDLNHNDSNEDDGDGSDDDADDDKNDNEDDDEDDDDNIKRNNHKNKGNDKTSIVNVPPDMDFDLDTDSDPDSETRVINPDEVKFNNNGKKISKKKLKLLAIQNALSVPASESGSGSSERSKVCAVCIVDKTHLFRCQWDASKQWKFVCKDCWSTVSGSASTKAPLKTADGTPKPANPLYRYGGTWKGRGRSP
eukprot:CAMPEP_0119053374 /NCGR_PEP_ID=MMETSP1177-20130426/74392_1 /TAXON_ID=2985 /ORGANISM="Ochromonas sp, Strain CCMP1899" /LENGTH=340 /DNA_ID=CAMNT_0007033313 /DNA_START=233 /DNA_END=1255 /DNA_ORIENTATION=-